MGIFNRKDHSSRLPDVPDDIAPDRGEAQSSGADVRAAWAEAFSATGHAVAAKLAEVPAFTKAAVEKGQVAAEQVSLAIESPTARIVLQTSGRIAKGMAAIAVQRALAHSIGQSGVLICKELMAARAQLIGSDTADTESGAIADLAHDDVANDQESDRS